MPAGKFQWSKFRKKLRKGILPLLAGGIIWAGILGYVFGEFNSLTAIAVLVLSGIALGANSWPDGEARLPRALRVEWERALAQWRKTSSAGLFSSARLELEKSRRSLRELVDKQRVDLEQLMQILEPKQRQAFLDSFEIDKALFMEVTRAHVEKLASWGYRSAGDIKRHRSRLAKLVPAPAAQELRAWAAQCSDNFKFSTRDATYVADAAKIEEKYSRQRRVILEELRRGPELLAEKRDQVADARARAEEELRRNHEHLRKRREMENE